MGSHFWLTCFLVSLLFSGVSAYGRDQGAVMAIADAQSKIRTHPAYSLTRTMRADLVPGSSGSIVPIRIEETCVTLFVRTGSVLRAYESCIVREKYSFYRLFSRGSRDNKTTVWDGSWIYSWNESGIGTKMVDVEINRGAAIVESLYSALKEDDNLRLHGYEMLQGRQCNVFESAAVILTNLLYIPGKAKIYVDRETGFPMRISVNSDKSVATVNYTKVDTNPTYKAQMFLPPATVTFDVIKGQEVPTPGQAQHVF